MQLDSVAQRKAFTSEAFKSSDMDMDKEGMRFATHYLRDKIYTDKPLAVVREYLANALDEHDKHKVDRPVEVTLPTKDEPFYKVRDFGKGLNEEGVRGIFGLFFKSTKNNAENAELIGGFGIGAKAGHAYGDQFTVTSWHEGIRSTYVFLLEGEGSLAVGKVLGVDEDFSDEPSGIEVSVPVLMEDVTAWSGNKFRIAFDFLTKFLSPEQKIKCDGVVMEPKAFTVRPNVLNGVTASGNRWEVLQNNSEIHVVVGFVPYSIRSQVLINQGVCGPSDAELLSGLVIQASPKDVSVALNREDIELSKTKTIPWLKAQFSDIVPRVVAEAETRLNACKTLSEALIVRRSLSSKLQRREEGSSWNGVNIERAIKARRLVSKSLAKKIVYFDSYTNSGLGSTKVGRWDSNYTLGEYIDMANGTYMVKDRIFVYNENERFMKKLRFVCEQNRGAYVVAMTKTDFACWESNLLNITLQLDSPKILAAEPNWIKDLVIHADDVVLPPVDANAPVRVATPSEKEIVFATYSHNAYRGRRDERALALSKSNPADCVMVKLVSSNSFEIRKNGGNVGLATLDPLCDIARKEGKTVLFVNKGFWESNDKILTLGEWYDSYVPAVTAENIAGAVAEALDGKVADEVREAARLCARLDDKEKKLTFNGWEKVIDKLSKHLSTSNYWNLKCEKAQKIAMAAAQPIAQEILDGIKGFTTDAALKFRMELVASPIYKKYPQKFIDILK
jgi:hypothetical protein